MANAMNRGSNWLSRVVIAFTLGSSAISAQALDQTYEISDLRFHGPADQNGWPIPVDVFEPGVVGHFLWTYTVGDFQNGKGTLLDLVLPITPLPLSEATTSVDLGQLSGTIPPDLHDMTYDFSIVFQSALTKPGQSTVVDPASTFDFTGSYMGSSPLSEWRGNIIAGTIAPLSSPVPEPSGTLLSAIGAAATLWGIRRRQPGARALLASGQERA